MPDIDRLSARIRHELWERDLAERGRGGRLAVRLARIVYGVARTFADGQLTLQAMSLVYTSLLSLVPLLAVSFSVLTAFGARGQLQPVLLELLAPLGAQAPVVSEQILAFVGKMQVGVLGSVGVAFLFYTVVSLVQKVERAFNLIWHVPGERGLARRFSDYLSVILIGPVLVFAALGVTASVLNSAVVQWLASIQPFGALIVGVSRLVPYLLICAAFAFMYVVIPNTRVRPQAALAGGVFAGVLWYTTGMLFTVFVANSANYSAIYSSFVGAVLFMIWLYVGWLIILVGAQVAFYWQNPRYLDPHAESGATRSRRSEALALEVMARIGSSHCSPNEAPCTPAALKDVAGGTDPDAVMRLLDTLEASGLIARTAADPPAYLPARAIDAIPLRDVVAAARGRPEAGAGPGAVDAVMSRIDAAIEEALRGRTVRDLVPAEAGRNGNSALA